MLQYEELRLRLINHEKTLDDLSEALGLDKMKEEWWSEGLKNDVRIQWKVDQDRKEVAAVRMISRFRGSRLFMPGCVVQSIIFHHFLSLYYRTDLSSETSRCCFPERRSRMGPFVSLYSSY